MTRVRRCESGIVRRAREYLDDHATNGVTLAELAHHLGVSRSYISHAFVRELGVAPYTYLRLCRVLAARHMLAAGEPPARVAYAAGYADQAHLTRDFKRCTGLTPGAYQRAQPPLSA